VPPTSSKGSKVKLPKQMCKYPIDNAYPKQNRSWTCGNPGKACRKLPQTLAWFDMTWAVRNIKFRKQYYASTHLNCPNTADSLAPWDFRCAPTMLPDGWTLACANLALQEDHVEVWTSSLASCSSPALGRRNLKLHPKPGSTLHHEHAMSINPARNINAERGSKV
jgi:hypothetical protein